MFPRQTINGVPAQNSTVAPQRTFVKVMSITPSPLSTALQQTISTVMSINSSAVVITSFTFLSLEMKVEAEYFIRVGGGNSSALISSLLRSIKSGVFTKYYISFSGIKTANASSLPSIFMINTSPSMRPSAASVNQPSTQSPLARLPSPQDNVPTSLPTLIPPQFSSYEVISFTAVTTLFGLTNLISASKTAEPGFISSLANSMVGVTVRDITVINFKYVASSGTGFATWNVSVVLDTIGANNGSAAFTYLFGQLNSSMSSGSFAILMRASSEALASLTHATTVVTGTYTMSTVLLPTATTTIPIITNLTLIEITRSTLTVAVTLHQLEQTVVDLHGGTLYCIAVSNGSLPTSIDEIKTSNSDTIYRKRASVVIPALSYPMMLEVKLTDLTSLEKYDIFCYAETSIGTGTTIAAILEKRVVATALCCKALDFTNAPVWVYGDLSKYTGSSKALYVFEYDLSAAPSSDVQIIPSLYLDGILSTAVIATPSSSTFLRTSLLTGQFFLSGTSFTSGTYTVGFQFSGTSRLQYSDRNITVQVLSSQHPLPAPIMISSQFSNSGQFVLITFSSPTNSPDTGDTTWACSALFAFVSASLATCTWTSATTVTVNFVVVTSADKRNEYLTIGSPVTLLGGFLRSFCQGNSPTCASNPTATNATVLTLGPDEPSVPTVIISSPARIGSCEDLVLDATGSYGSGGRPYASVLWTVSAITPGVSGLLVANTSAIQDYLNKFSVSNKVNVPITLSRSSLTIASYTITLRLLNFLGHSASATKTVSVSIDSAVPSLTIIGPSYRTTTTSTPLTILSTATYSSCASTVSSVKYSWTVQTGSPSVFVDKPSTSRDPSRYTVSANSFAVGSTYIVTITASVDALSSSAAVTVYVVKGPVIAAVVGGYTRSVPVNQDLVLDASISKDSDAEPNAKSSLNYKWSCIISSQKNYGAACDFFGSITSTTNAIRILQNKMFSSNIYSFTVIATSGDGRSDSQTVIVTPTSTGKVGISITTSFTRFNPTAKLVINSNIDSATATTSEWSVFTPLGVSVPFTALTPSLRLFADTDAGSKILFPLSLDANTLRGGSYYTFRLTAFETGSSGGSTYSEVVLFANAPPTGGYVLSTPPAGNALITRFSIASPGWTTDVANFPLTYVFTYRLSEASTYLTLAASSLRAFTISTLPAGLSTEDSMVSLQAQAADIFSTYAVATTTARVTLDPKTNVPQILNSTLKSAFSSGNVNLAIQTVNNVSDKYFFNYGTRALKFYLQILYNLIVINFYLTSKSVSPVLLIFFAPLHRWHRQSMLSVVQHLLSAPLCIEAAV